MCSRQLLPFMNIDPIILNNKPPKQHIKRLNTRIKWILLQKFKAEQHMKTSQHDATLMPYNIKTIKEKIQMVSYLSKFKKAFSQIHSLS